MKPRFGSLATDVKEDLYIWKCHYQDSRSLVPKFLVPWVGWVAWDRSTGWILHGCEPRTQSLAPGAGFVPAWSDRTLARLRVLARCSTRAHVVQHRGFPAGAEIWQMGNSRSPPPPHFWTFGDPPGLGWHSSPDWIWSASWELSTPALRCILLRCEMFLLHWRQQNYTPFKDPALVIIISCSYKWKREKHNKPVKLDCSWPYPSRTGVYKNCFFVLPFTFS